VNPLTVAPHDFLVAFGLTLFAGLATGIGGALAFFVDRTQTKPLSVALGFSAGVMLFVSFVEIFPQAQRFLSAAYGARGGYLAATLAFFGGVALSALIDKLIPAAQNVHEIHRVEEARGCGSGADLEADAPGRHRRRRAGHVRALYRVGLFTAVAVAVHNFPEGLATFTVAFKDLKLGIPIALAIAIHNIPEGIAVSVPICYASGNRRKAFAYSFLSGLAEPVGGLIGFLVLLPFLSDALFGVLFAAVAGIMVFISLDELLPAAREYGEHHLSIYGLVAGMAVMALSMALFI